MNNDSYHYNNSYDYHSNGNVYDEHTNGNVYDDHVPDYHYQENPYIGKNNYEDYNDYNNNNNDSVKEPSNENYYTNNKDPQEREMGNRGETIPPPNGSFHENSDYAIKQDYYGYNGSHKEPYSNYNGGHKEGYGNGYREERGYYDNEETHGKYNMKDDQMRMNNHYQNNYNYRYFLFTITTKFI
jgi:hypothetical protein